MLGVGFLPVAAALVFVVGRIADVRALAPSLHPDDVARVCTTVEMRARVAGFGLPGALRTAP